MLGIRRDVVGRYHWLRFEPRLKVILLSCTLVVVSLIAGCAGTSGPSQDNAADSTQRTGLAANQTVDNALGSVAPWCQLVAGLVGELSCQR